MKTFKLIGLKMIHKSLHSLKREEIPLVDGLIINKEDEQKNWLVEIVVDKKHHEFFQNALESGLDFLIHATITKPTNDPATFAVTVQSITEMAENISVLLDAKIVLNKTKFAETVLADLIHQGFEGNELLNMFKEKIETARS